MYTVINVVRIFESQVLYDECPLFLTSHGANQKWFVLDFEREISFDFVENEMSITGLWTRIGFRTNETERTELWS